MSSPLSSTYNPLPIRFAYGQGAWLWDTTGKKYLDGLSGIAVCGLGHAHPAVTAAIATQAAKLLHVSNLYHIAEQEALAAALTKIAEMEQAFFCNSGAEANEAALKLARLYGHKKNLACPTVIVMEGSFHGRTLATLSASGNRKIQAGYEPLVQGFIRSPFNDLAALRTIAKNNHDIVAVLVEPIQGEGGIIVPDEGYLAAVRQLCDEHDWLMMLDEVQTGVGRTGKMFAYQHAKIIPDVVTLAKGLANGVPIGACLTADKACGLFGPGKHGSTFGGNPLACHTAFTVLNVIATENLLNNAAQRGQQLLTGFTETLASCSAVTDIRGKGLMIGIELDRPCREILQIGLEHAVLFSVTQDNVIRLLPPLIYSEQEASLLVERVTACIQQFIR